MNDKEQENLFILDLIKKNIWDIDVNNDIILCSCPEEDTCDKRYRDECLYYKQFNSCIYEEQFFKWIRERNSNPELFL
ncbi:MAG: hypothetical protein PHF21_02740 [Bacilli bacterium]|nr:hypothetical protein [Bacilli bacterium]